MPCGRKVSRADVARFQSLLKDNAPTAKQLNKIVDDLRKRAMKAAALGALKGGVTIKDFIDVVKKTGLEAAPWARPENITRIFGMIGGQGLEGLNAMNESVATDVKHAAKKVQKVAEHKAKVIAKQAGKLAGAAQDKLEELWAKIPAVPIHELMLVFSLLSEGKIEKKLRIIFDAICGSGASAISKARIIELLKAVGRGGMKLATKISGGKGKLPGGSIAKRLKKGIDSDIGKRAIKLVAHNLFGRMDEDDDGEIDWEEFRDGCLTRDSLFRAFFVWFDKTRARLTGSVPKRQQGELKILGGQYSKPTKVYVRLAKSGKKEKLQVFNKKPKGKAKRAKADLTIKFKGDLALHDCDTDDKDSHKLPKVIKKADDTEEWFSLTPDNGVIHYFKASNRETAYDWWDELEEYATHVEEDEDSNSDDDLFTMKNAAAVLFGGSESGSDDSDDDSDSDSDDESGSESESESDSDDDSESESES